MGGGFRFNVCVRARACLCLCSFIKGAISPCISLFFTSTYDVYNYVKKKVIVSEEVYYEAGEGNSLETFSSGPGCLYLYWPLVNHFMAPPPTSLHIFINHY